MGSDGTADQPAPPDDVEALLEPLLALPETEQAAALDELCYRHPHLAERLRRQFSTIRQWLDTPPLDPTAAASMPLQIGPYRILGVLGEGGMGVVYLAEQTQPVRRPVAVKLIKLGMDSAAVLRRFELERQALAVMAHESIAKVFDCGTSERGQPYFAMEYVKGIPLTTYCDRNRLALPERLRLFAETCAAVQHAHQKGVVHRDLKPSNVLVTDESGKPVAKIIDFGLARATDQAMQQGLWTELGRVLGTPEYMSPEQANPTVADIDTRTDIYSLGVMLYELLVGELPFSTQTLREHGADEMQRVIREVEPPRPSTRLISGRFSAGAAAARRTSLGTLQRALKNDLDWVVLKAMEKDRNRRYETANALAADLQRFLDHEPLLAGPPSAGYRLKKLVRRHRAQVLAGSAVMVTAIVGAVFAVNFACTAQANAALANEKAQDALREQRRADQQSAELTAKVREFDQLAAVVVYERAIRDEEKLYPAWPSRIPALEHWLQEDAGKLLALQPEIEVTVRNLQARALPQNPEELEADRRAHSQFAAFELQKMRVASLRQAQALRAGNTPLVVPALPSAQQSLAALALNTLAWERIAPTPGERKIYGEEALALSCARVAAAKAKGTASESQLLDTLAWALLANGQDREAKAASDAAVAAASAETRETCRGWQRDLHAAVDAAAQNVAAAEAELADLTTAVSTRRTFRFAIEAQQFLHQELSTLLTQLASLATKERVEVAARLGWAKQVQELSLAHPHARQTWAAVRAAIATADDLAASKSYAGKAIDLRDEHITGLVPIGMNPVTKLWEFYELRSAWDGKVDPRTISIPVHRPDGSIEVTADTGIVFVLLPGGTFTMDAQRHERQPREAGENGPADPTPGAMTLAPFFLARHELTQGQWARLWYGESRWRQPSQYQVGQTDLVGGTITWTHPVEQVDWPMCDTLLWRHGLVLPTEAQWEYGCQAGATTPWTCALEELQRFANLADATVEQAGIKWMSETWTDGHIVHAPVGSFAANNLGLYDVHGNVWEWCRDEYGTEAVLRPGDGLRLRGDGSGDRCSRGGSFGVTAAAARSANRGNDAPTFRDESLGVRAARLLVP